MYIYLDVSSGRWAIYLNLMNMQMPKAIRGKRQHRASARALCVCLRGHAGFYYFSIEIDLICASPWLDLFYAASFSSYSSRLSLDVHDGMVMFGYFFLFQNLA